MITLPNPCDALDERTITTPDGEFVLQFKRPTYQDRLEDDSLAMIALAGTEAARGLAFQKIRRIERCVVGWSEIQDERGEHVPFSLDVLGQVLSAWPSVAKQVHAILRDLHSSERAAGESESRLAAGSAGAQ